MNKRNVIITIISVLILTCLFAFARTTTTDLVLVKPIWTEDIDILDDINANSDLLEAFANDVLEHDLSPVLRAALDIATFDIEGVDATEFGYLNGISSFGGTLIDDANASAARTTLELAIGTNIQAYDAGLTSIAGLTTAANKSIYTTALDTYATYDLSAFGRTIIDDADGAAVRTTIGAEVDLSNEAGLYAVLSDVADFVQGAEVNSIDSGMYVDASIDHEHLAPDVVSGMTDVTSADGDYILIWDVTDSALKKCDMGEVRSSGYTNLTSFVDQTAWRVFYSNTDGDVTELALGVDGTYLRSNGAAAAPTFTAPAGGGDVTKVGTPVDSQVGVWTGDGTIEGAASFTYDGSNLGLTGDIGITGTRITKGWFTDFEVTNAIAGSITGNAVTFTATDNENEALACPIVFVDGATGAQGAETDDTDFTYNPSTGNISATQFEGIVAGNLVDKSAAETLTGDWVNTDNPWADNEVADNITIDLATLATTITVTDNENTAEENPICFVAGADPDGGSLGIETDGTLTYNPSTGVVTTTGFAGALTGNVTGDTSGSSGSCTGNAATSTTASAGDAAVDFFGAGVDAVTDATTCTDIEGTLLAIGGGVLNAAIPADHVTYDMMQDATATDKILGRSTAGAGTIEEIACTAAGRAILDDADAAAQRTTLSAAGSGANTDLTSVLNAAFYAGRDADNTINFATDNHIIFKTSGATAMEVDSTGELDMNANSIGFTQQAVTGSDTTTTIDWKLGNKFKFTFGAMNETFTFTAPTNPCNIMLMLIQDGTGSRTATWPGTVKWAGGTAPTLTTAASTIDICSFYWDGTNYFGVASLAFAVP